MSRLVIAILVGLIVSYYGIGSRVTNTDENIEDSEVLTQLFEKADQVDVFVQYNLKSMYKNGGKVERS